MELVEPCELEDPLLELPPEPEDDDGPELDDEGIADELEFEDDEDDGGVAQYVALQSVGGSIVFTGWVPMPQSMSKPQPERTHTFF